MKRTDKKIHQVLLNFFAPISLPVRFMLLSIISLSASAQHTLSFADAYTGNDQLLTAPLPVLVEWKGSQQLLFKKTDPVSQSDQFFTANLQSRQITAAERPEPAPALLFRFPSKISLPTASPDRQCGAYVRNNNIFLVEQKHPTVFAVTSDGNDSTLNGLASYVYQEEITGSNTMRWSPNSQYLAFMRFDESNVPVFSLYVTDTDEQNGRLEKYRYPKAGQKNPAVRIGIFNRTTRKTVWADFNEKDDQYFGVLRFSADNKLIVKWVNRRQNQIKVFEVDPDNGSRKLLYEETQSTWVNINNAASITWIDSGRNIIIGSDKTGRTHFYLYTRDGSFVNTITSGDFDAEDLLGIDETEDYMAVGRWLKQQPWVHPSKLCITGFSAGGRMTLLALTYGADVFDYGVAYYGPPDWRFYDTQYTEVVNALQEQGKHFEFILYPGVRHGFRGKKWLHSKQELAVFINKYLLK